jgi:hypothetical protein
VSRPIALTAFLLCLAALVYAAAYRFLWEEWPTPGADWVRLWRGYGAGWPRLDGLPVDRWFWRGDPVPFEVLAQ